MLHRISMRVLPALTLAVTEDGFRKRKRLLMLFPGLLAFALYRALHQAGWHENVWALLLASGLFSTCVALAGYGFGREQRMRGLVQEDGGAHLLWVGLRFGFVYGVQLSLMVLGLLYVFSYSYTDHPDGPAMMVLIIASTSVFRDAFELGHLRLLRQQGRLFLTCPDVKKVWALLAGRPELWEVTRAAAVAGVAYLGLAFAIPWVQTDLGQLLVIGMLTGAAGTAAYLKGLQQALTLRRSFSRYSWTELGRFFLWPGVAFGWTYNLILLGITTFLMVLPSPPLTWRVLVAASTAGLISLYCYYLGRCRWQEEKLQASSTPAILRCPFLVGILSSKKV